MNNIKTILVATDFSAAAKNAADYAAALAKETNARVILFHSYMLPVPVSEIPFVTISADEIQKDREDDMKHEVERLSGFSGSNVDWIVRIGIPYDEINDIQEEESVDLVVMGMKAAGINKWIGSTSDEVIRKLKKPVLAVPEHAGFSRPVSITYATDFNADMHLECFELLLCLLRTFGAALSVVHVKRDAKEDLASQNAGKSKLEAIWNDIPHQYYEVGNHNMEEAIDLFTREQPTDMLVLVSHHHNFLQHLFGDHLTKELSARTQIPLLVLHDVERR
jgi:nucleotide-binding universal stress UspA family protein